MPISQVQSGDLITAAHLNSIADAVNALLIHAHDWASITGKPSTFPASAHTHPWSDLTGVPSTFTPAAHTHLWADITDKPSTFTPSAHNQAASTITSGTFADARIGQSNVTQHQGALSIGWTQITGTPSTFTPSAHAHAISDVTGLQTALDGKQASLPAIAGNAGKVLRVNSGATGLEWATISGGSSQWADVQGGIAYTTGQVGVNNGSPAYPLDVGGAMRLVPASQPTGASGVLYCDSGDGRMKAYVGGAWFTITPEYGLVITWVSALNATIGSGLTRYIVPNGAAQISTSGSGVKLAQACRVTGFRVKTTSANGGSSGNLTFTLRKNSSDQSMTVNIAAGAAAGDYDSSGSAIDFAVDDVLDMKLVNGVGATSASMAHVQWFVQFKS